MVPEGPLGLHLAHGGVPDFGNMPFGVAQVAMARYKMGQANRNIAASAPYRQALANKNSAQADYARSNAGLKQELGYLRQGMTDINLTEAQRAAAKAKYISIAGDKTKQDPRELAAYKYNLANGAIDPRTGQLMSDGADDQDVEGYADGGTVQAIGAPTTNTQQIHPALAQYGQYLNSAAQSGVAPVPFSQYINLLQSTRATMQTSPPAGFADGGDVSEMDNPGLGYADGGDVSALRRPISGPGTGTSDSIPAVINGQHPAALSAGEFVIPAAVVKAKGTEFFEKLIAQYVNPEKQAA